MRLTIFTLAAVAVLLAAGCAKKFTRDNFEIITAGVDERDDVRRILGEPRTTWGDSDRWYYEDEDRYMSAVIVFGEDGRVAGKTWFDAPAGEISGTDPSGDPPPRGEIREQRTRSRTIDR